MIRSIVFILATGVAVDSVCALPQANHFRRGNAQLVDAAKSFQLPDYSDLTKYVTTATQLPANEQEFDGRYQKYELMKRFGKGFETYYNSASQVFTTVRAHAVQMQNDILPDVEVLESDTCAYGELLVNSLNSIMSAVSTTTDANFKSTVIDMLNSAITSANNLVTKTDAVHTTLKTFETVAVKDADIASKLDRGGADIGVFDIQSMLKRREKQQEAWESYKPLLADKPDQYAGLLAQIKSTADEINMLKALLGVVSDLDKTAADVKAAVPGSITSVAKIKDAFAQTSAGLQFIMTHFQQAGDAVAITDIMKQEVQAAATASEMAIETAKK